MMDYEEDLETIQSADYENKYFLVFPQSGYCFMWDYEIQPYVVTSRGETDPRKLCWFLFDHFYVTQFLKVGTQLLYISSYYNETDYVFKQVLDGSCFSTDGWTASGTGASFSVSGNVGYFTAGTQARTRLSSPKFTAKDNESYYITYEVKNTSSVPVEVEYDTFEPNSNDFVRKSSLIVYSSYPYEPETEERLTLSLTQQLSVDATIEVRNFMAVNVNEFVKFYSDTPQEDLLTILDGVFNDYVAKDSEATYTAVNDMTNSLVKLNNTFVDLDFDGDGKNEYIHCYYQTPFIQFGAVEMLKNVSNVYIQSRGDVHSKIDLYYYTNDSADGEPDLEPIQVGGHGLLWDNFDWNNFIWQMNSWGNTVRRKCNLKKIQMASIYFEDNENADMSITHIGMQYQLVKYIR
jgi:hypothetical protein